MTETTTKRVFFVHDQALCESEQVGGGARIWAFAHVMKGAVVGEDANIGEHVFVEAGASVGDGAVIKNGVQVWAGVHIGPNAFVGPCAVFSNDKFPRSRHLPQAAARYEKEENWLAGIRLGRGASVGAGAVITPGVSIGDYAMVGAGAVVTKDVAPHRLVAGNPARPSGWVCKAGFVLRKSPDAGYTCPGCGKNMGEQDGAPVFTEAC